MKVKLSDITDIQFGLHTKPETVGDVLYLQAKQFNDSGDLFLGAKAYVKKDLKNNLHILRNGDVLFVGKGFRNFAWTYSSDIGAAIASSIFFVIRPKNEIVLGEFLTIIFNTEKYQAYFRSLGAGSKITSIRKSELEAILIDLPDMKTQKLIVELKKLHKQDLDLSRLITEHKEIRFQSLVNKLINNS